MTEQRRDVVVTGIGLITALSSYRDESWRRIIAGEGGVQAISHFDADDFPVHIAAEVPDFDPERALDRKNARRTDRVIQFAVVAAAEAIEQSGLDLDAIDSTRAGVFIGTALGGIETFENGVRTLSTRGPKRVSPFFVPMSLVDMSSGYVSIRFGLRGPNMATISACSSGGHAIGEALETIRRGQADVMLAGGVEAAVTPAGVAGFAAAGALSSRNDEPEAASRPFDAERDGFVLGEGGAILVLESAEHAERRAARPLARLSGYGSTADAFHITQPAEEGEGAARAMTIALQDAGLTPDQISYVNAHGTSTRLNDKFETMAIKRVYGEAIPPVSSTKGATGHLLGAAPAIEAAFSVLAIQDGVVPPTINYCHPDPECDLDVIPNEARQLALQHVMSNSFGFGGHNAVLIFSRV